jgi:outer membrane receptor protein involved in Fe transport
VPPDTIHALNLLLDPTVSTTYEIGTKQLVEIGDGNWKGTLIYDVALYWVLVSNDIIPYRNGRFYFTAGKTRRSGGEFGAKLQMTNGVFVDAALTVSNNRYLEYRVDSVHYNPVKAGVFADYKDNEVAGVPSVFYSAAIKFAPPAAKGAYVRVGIQGTGRYYVDDPNRFSVSSWLVMNATVGLEKLQIGESGFFLAGLLGVQNLLDERYVGSAWINPDLNSQGKPMYIEPGIPRNFILSFTLGTTL